MRVCVFEYVQLREKFFLVFFYTNWKCVVSDVIIICSVCLTYIESEAQVMDVIFMCFSYPVEL